MVPSVRHTGPWIIPTQALVATAVVKYNPVRGLVCIRMLISEWNINSTFSRHISSADTPGRRDTASRYSGVPGTSEYSSKETYMYPWYVTTTIQHTSTSNYYNTLNSKHHIIYHNAWSLTDCGTKLKNTVLAGSIRVSRKNVPSVFVHTDTCLESWSCHLVEYILALVR